MEKSIKSNFYNFMRKQIFGPFASMGDYVNKKQYIEILKELEDVSRNSVECLNETQTEILRKYVGVYEKKYTINEIASNLNAPASRICQMLELISRKLYYRIERGYANLQDAVLNNEITQDELLNMNLIILDYKDIYKLHRCGCATIRDVIESSYDKLIKCPNIGKQRLEEIVNYIHSLGLVFEDEESYNKNYSQKTLDTKEQLKIRLEMAEKAEEKCDSIIERQMNKKQQLIELKNELLEKLAQFQDEPKVNKIGTR